MPPSSRIPPLLNPYVRLPRDDSILLLTSTLGASANWLIVRFLCDALAAPTQEQGGAHGDAARGGEEARAGASVVLVSWMREYEFWKQEARKSGGLDLERCRRESRFAFVDGLSALCVPTQVDEQKEEAQTVEKRSPGLETASGRRGILPVRGPPPSGSGVPSRGPVSTGASPNPARVAPSQSTTSTTTTMNTHGFYTLTSLSLPLLKSTLSTALASVQHTTSSSSSTTTTTTTNLRRKTLLILDNPDLALALSAPPPPSSSLPSLLLILQSTHPSTHIMVHLQADTPLLQPSAPRPQPLELAQNNLLVKTAHMSRRILSLRVLDTGVARDVSGVLRVTGGADSLVNLGLHGGGGGAGEKEEEEENKELLYLIRGDGSVRVFDRGVGADGG